MWVLRMVDKQPMTSADGRETRVRDNYIRERYKLTALNRSAEVVRRAFDQLGEVGIMLVGSSLMRPDFRDVDVRLVMTDDGYDKLFRIEPQHAELGHPIDPLWSLLCTTISAWMSQQTGLPIDFQIQRMSNANAEHNGPRNALGITLDYPGERPSLIKDGRETRRERE